MSEGVFKAPKSKKSMDIEDDEQLATTSKRPRTAEDFYMFCKFILEYENYDVVKQEELREKSGSPIGSTGSLSDSIKSESTSGSIPDDRKGSEVDLAKTGSQEWNWNGIHFSGSFGPCLQKSIIQNSAALAQIHTMTFLLKDRNNFGNSATIIDRESWDSSLKLEKSCKYRDANELLGCRERLSQQVQASQSITPGLLGQGVKWAYYEDSYDLITCYCMKPFAGRPMIECSKCLTWIHLSCAKIKKTNIPEVFICIKCKNHTVRRPSLRSISGTSPNVRTKKKLSV